MCSVIRGQTPLTFKWYKNGKLMDESSKEATADKFSALVIDPVRATSAGNYTCVVSNSYGSSSYSSLLVVKCKYFKKIYHIILSHYVLKLLHNIKFDAILFVYLIKIACNPKLN